MSDNPFSKVSVNVERKVQPKMAAGSWQECSGWKTSDSSWSEGVWNKKWKEPEGEIRSSSGRKEVKESLMCK